MHSCNAQLQASAFAIERERSKWLHLCCCSASSSDAFTILLHSDIWKHTMTHLVEGTRGQITVRLVDRCLKQTRSLEDVEFLKKFLITLLIIVLCPFLHLYNPVFLILFLHLQILAGLQPPHRCTNSIPCWQKRVRFTHKNRWV